MYIYARELTSAHIPLLFYLLVRHLHSCGSLEVSPGDREYDYILGTYVFRSLTVLLS